MRELAFELLYAFNSTVTREDHELLAADLEGVKWDAHLDGVHNKYLNTKQLFLSRIGGLGALGRYMQSIRASAERKARTQKP